MTLQPRCKECNSSWGYRRGHAGPHHTDVRPHLTCGHKLSWLALVPGAEPWGKCRMCGRVARLRDANGPNHPTQLQRALCEGMAIPGVPPVPPATDVPAEYPNRLKADDVDVPSASPELPEQTRARFVVMEVRRIPSGNVAVVLECSQADFSDLRLCVFDMVDVVVSEKEDA